MFSATNWRRTNPAYTTRVLVDEFVEIHGKPAAKYEAARSTAKARPAHELPGRDRPERTGYDDQLDREFEALCRDLHDEKRCALCFSGGGIRSAAFSLGVLQTLAQADLLPRFHYLSTVSGGGYIGAWLSTWIAKAKGGWADVEPLLKGKREAGAEPKQIRHLRENTRYLTQKAGLTSGDTWTAVAISIRNVLLNWTLVLPLIGALTIVPKLLMAALAASVDLLPAGERLDAAKPFAVLALALYACAVFVMALNRPRWTRRNLSRKRYGTAYQLPFLTAAAAWTIAAILLPPPAVSIATMVLYVGLPAALYALAWSFAITGWWWGPGQPLVYVDDSSRRTWTEIMCAPRRRQKPSGFRSRNGILTYTIRLSKKSGRDVTVSVTPEDRQAINGINYKVAPIPNRFKIRAGQTSRRFDIQLLNADAEPPFSIEGRKIDTRDLRVVLSDPEHARIAQTPWVNEAWADVGWSAVRGAIVGLAILGAHVLFGTMIQESASNTRFLLPILFWFPAAIGAHMIASIAFHGLNNKTPKSENDREWHGRLDGFGVAIGIAWILWVTATVVVPEAIMTGSHALGFEGIKKLYSSLLAVGGATGTVVAWLGQSAKTSATNDPGGSWQSRVLLPAAGMFFIVSLIVSISLILDQVFGDKPFLGILETETDVASLAWSLLVLGACLSIVPLTLGFSINVNRFSLHSVYRNRLIRAFLGASTDRSREKPDKFTGFQDNDNIEMQRLWERRSHRERDSSWRPFHVVNIALNVVSSRNLQLQDRKALPFVVTPLWCGSAALDGGRGAFRRSSEFGGEEKTITIGTAMAISGAAVSPNMGYHSSPLVSFLLTLFNVRLGWWYGNPIDPETYRLEGPRWAIKSLAYEAFGLTDETRPYVYLSDGGHFDNLGLYEMVRRRCHQILVVDAGQDPTCAFEDLANSLARIQTDFGIPIDIDLTPIRKRNDNRFTPCEGGDGFAIGNIRYKAVDPGEPEDGRLYYLKPSFRGDEPAAILGYANTSGSFPHESTLDQWFTEPQFESYRALGETMTENVLMRSRAGRVP